MRLQAHWILVLAMGDEGGGEVITHNVIGRATGGALYGGVDIPTYPEHNDWQMFVPTGPHQYGSSSTWRYHKWYEIPDWSYYNRIIWDWRIL